MTHASTNKKASASAAGLLASGHRLGGYELRTLLGSGAMADVYLGLQTSLGRKVAVKVLREPRHGHRETSIERFMQEARAAASLVHGNIVQIYEVGCVDDIHFIAEEYVAGPTLKQWLHERGPLSPPQAVSVLEQVGAAFSHTGKRANSAFADGVGAAFRFDGCSESASGICKKICVSHCATRSVSGKR
ncbi:serine/threonine protein kinase [bacterium]|nr:serine/threonine protein kinase [bacterium]